MFKPKLKDTKVIFGPCRLSYVHLFEKYSFDGGDDGKYMTSILIPKSETETVDAIRQAIENAKKNGLREKWGGKLPKKFNDEVLRDGDEREDGDAAYAGHYYLTAKCNTRPGIVDRQSLPITDEDEVYSGMWGIVSVTMFPFAVSVNNGIACGLNNVMKWKDDDFLGGRASAAADFDGFADGDGDDDIM